MATREPLSLTKQELKVIRLLDKALNKFSKSCVLFHPSDLDDFLRAVHTAQNIVMARLAVRAQPEVFYDGRRKDRTN